MNIKYTVISPIVLLASFGVSGSPVIAEEAPKQVASVSCDDVCGYAVIGENGQVHGVIVCQEGCFGGVMPIDYMGCPAGCSLVLQSPADGNGNVAGVNGTNVHYSPENNTFTRTNPESGEIDWSIVGGQPIEDGYIAPPNTTVPAPSPDQDNNVISPETPETTTPPPTTTPTTTQAPSSDVGQLSFRSTNTQVSSLVTKPFISSIRTAIRQRTMMTRVFPRPALGIMRIIRY